jgi:uncharacterized protein YicC (UPF0701 family)
MKNPHECIQEVTIALITQQMKNIESKLDNVDIKIDNFIKEIRENYVTQIEHTETKLSLKELRDKLWSINASIL